MESLRKNKEEENVVKTIDLQAEAAVGIVKKREVAKRVFLLVKILMKREIADGENAKEEDNQLEGDRIEMIKDRDVIKEDKRKVNVVIKLLFKMFRIVELYRLQVAPI